MQVGAKILEFHALRSDCRTGVKELDLCGAGDGDAYANGVPDKCN